MLLHANKTTKDFFLFLNHTVHNKKIMMKIMLKQW